jgi:hypothetical protein
LPNKQGFANSIPFFVAGFQQFSEKQCGKASRNMSNAAQRARFGALHMIGCGLLKCDEFFRRGATCPISFFLGEKGLHSLLIERYDPVPQIKERCPRNSPLGFHGGRSSNASRSPG